MTETPKEQAEFIDTPGLLTGRSVIMSGQNTTIGNIKFYIGEEANYELVYPNGTRSNAVFSVKFLMNPRFCVILAEKKPTP